MMKMKLFAGQSLPTIVFIAGERTGGAKARSGTGAKAGRGSRGRAGGGNREGDSGEELCIVAGNTLSCLWWSSHF